MKLHAIDIAIIVLYLLATVIIGLVLKKRAERDKSSYLLGGNELPWYMLGLSNASGMFDISGTMWLVTLGFVYGLKSIWIPWLWPTFNQIFLMVFLSMWLRRSGVTTGAEWIGFRFGQNRGSVLSHRIVVLFALISCLGFLAYGFIGLGKFMMIFIPWPSVTAWLGIDPQLIAPEYIPHVYGIVFTLFATFYAVLGGMLSIVWADVLQYGIMTVSSLVIGGIAMVALAGSSLPVPEGWLSPGFGWTLDLDWTGIIDEVNAKIAEDGFSLFSVFMMMMLFKGFFVSMAGPAPNYDMQKILAAKSPAEAAKMSGMVSLVLNPVRYIMITAFVVLGLLYYNRLNLVVGTSIDFEQILPSAIAEFVPVGLTGLILAGLLAAFMSTFAGTLNAAQAYLVNDIYLKAKPQASASSLKWMIYIVGIATVAVSIVLGFFAKDVNSLLQWIVAALWGSYVAANVLKWYWWRFNSYGYFWGMVSGIIPALVFPLIFKQTLELYYFPLIFAISIIGSLIGTYARPATDPATLANFYRRTHPWGFWKPILQQIRQQEPDFETNKNFKADMLNVLVGIVWQMSLVSLPVYLVLMQPWGIAISLLITTLTSIYLKQNWWNKLTTEH